MAQQTGSYDFRAAKAAADAVADLDTFVRGEAYVPTEDVVAIASYSLADVEAGDSVAGMYELVDGEYVPTQDSVAQAGKDYYKKGVKDYYTRSGSGTEEDPYIYTAASVNEGDSVEGLYELSDRGSFVGQTLAAQDAMQGSLGDLEGRTGELEASHDGMQQSLDSISSTTAELSEAYGGMQQSLDSIGGATTQLSEAHYELAGTVSDLSDALDDATERIDSSLDALADDISGVSSTVVTANIREQAVYCSAPAGTATMQPSTVWADATGEQGEWTSARPQYDAAYPVMFTAIQRQTVAQAETSECSCTDPVIDETTTILDGGRIIANSITASKIDVESLWAALMQAEDLIVGKEDAAHMEASGTRLSFLDGNGNEVAYIEVNESTGESTFYMTRSVVVEDMYFGDGLWKFYRRSNRNMSLKWMGGE